MTINGLEKLERTKMWLCIAFKSSFHNPSEYLTENEYYKQECKRHYEESLQKISEGEMDWKIALYAAAIGLFHFGEFQYVYDILDGYEYIKKRSEPTGYGSGYLRGIHVLQIVPFPKSVYPASLNIAAIRNWLRENEPSLIWDKESFLYRLEKPNDGVDDANNMESFN